VRASAVRETRHAFAMSIHQTGIRERLPEKLRAPRRSPASSRLWPNRDEDVRACVRSGPVMIAERAGLSAQILVFHHEPARGCDNLTAHQSAAAVI
jgi:hypothetical protein